MLGLIDNIKLRRKLNTVTGEKEMLEEIIKDKLYKSFMDKLNESLELPRLRRENRRLRQQVKQLKQERGINNGSKKSN